MNGLPPQNSIFYNLFTVEEKIPSLLLPIQKHFEHLEISPFTIYLHSNYTRISSEAVLKNSRYCHCKVVKTLDFIGLFGGSSARCEMAFSQFSRKFLAGFSQFPNVFEPILNWFGDYLGQFNSLRRHIEAVITRLS